MNARGFSLFGCLLALVIAASSLAMLAPALMRWGEYVEQQKRLVNVVDETMLAMTDLMAPYHSEPNCKGIIITPTLANLGVQALVDSSGWHIVPSYRSKLQYVLSITATTPEIRRFLIKTFAETDYLTEESGNVINVIFNAPLITSDYQHVNFNPQDECFE
ncbi:hypothetical protein [Shewanella xiamenensis]|uniref:Uncharacterized protein n=1 Tax=Shewanella xiamenensis TaxID=332186 RepID=A0ABT6UGV6_9GAMM|nr:hypothetical protein [Shewanella xiamenensis]MDI5833709.1 hypothetical protein [Shewanella xiamenensis]